jgi:MoaA/NifB/PqqE/SkfB family radical SAM enzyme
MARIVVELTNRCNLRCQHCIEERHAATGDLPVNILEKVLREAKLCNVGQLSFTGGEPTLHREFSIIVQRLCSAGYTFSLISNGSTFPRVYPLLEEYRNWFKGVSFSLDGAREQTHDSLRGSGSFRQVMRAVSICVVRHLPFTFNMVLTSKNRHEIAEMIELAWRLGGGGLRFGHLISTPATSILGLDLSPAERRETEDEIWKLKKDSPLPVGIAPGYHRSTPFFACGPLLMEEYNLDYRGNLTFCCHLSGCSGKLRGSDFIGSLQEISLAEACVRFAERVAAYVADRQKAVRCEEFERPDRSPCRYCFEYFGAAPRLEARSFGRESKGDKNHDHSGSICAPSS